MDFLDRADLAVAHQFAAAAEAPVGAPLRAVLEHAAVAVEDVDQRQVFGDRHAQCLLAVNVLASLGGQRRHGHVPVVGQGEHQGVHVATRQDFAEVLEGGQLRPLRHAVAAVLPRVAHGNRLCILVAAHGREVLRPSVAESDKRQSDPLARRGLVLGPSQRRGAHDHRRRRGGCAYAAQKAATGYGSAHEATSFFKVGLVRPRSRFRANRADLAPGRTAARCPP